MRVQLLGAVQICAGGEAVGVGTPQRCLVLAALAVDAGRLVSMETLVDRVWRPGPPREARRTVQTHIANIRGVMKRITAPASAVPLVRRPGGYLLDLDPDQVDVLRFRRLASRAAQSGQSAVQAVALWREALGLWQGEPLAGLRSDWPDRARQSWRREYRDAVLAWAHTEIQTDNPTVVIGPLTELIEQDPLHEALPAMLMRALYAAGHRTEALDCYTATRGRLDQDRAEQPGPALRALYHAILRRDPRLPAPAGALPAATAAPALLPADIPGFAGRSQHLADLDALLTGHHAHTADGGSPTAVVISAIAGTAGVGKTALAVHWAHRVRRRFPDGQLYIDLRGFAPTGTAMDPADAVRRFLDALDVPAPRIPTDPAAQADLYRTLLADKRMLIVLDNAHDSAQVEPLLPAAPGCLVVVTSRNQLTGLITAGARLLPLDLLTHDEAHQLLQRRLGPGRVGAEPDAVDQLTHACARLPLALAILAARARAHPRFPLAALAAELRDASALDTLAGDTPATNLRTVFSWSYHTLTPAAGRLFRLLGIHAGPDISTPAAASLTALPIQQVRPLLAELTRAHLILEHQPGRYTLHDLLRAYATDLANHTNSAADQHAATHRLLDHYLHTAYTAARLLNPHRTPIAIALTPPQSGVTPEQPTDHPQALAWFTTEHQALLATIDHATATGFDTHTWQLAWTLDTFLSRRGHWRELASSWRTALAAAGRLADPTAQGHAHRYLARAYNLLGRYDDADIQLRHALDLYRQAGDQTSEAKVHKHLVALLARQGRHAEGLHHARQALNMFQAAHDRRGQALTLSLVGWCHAQLADHHQALTYCQKALNLFQRLGDRGGQAATWHSLGYAHHHLNHHTQATTCYQHAIDLYRDLGNRYAEADTLARLGDTHHTAGNHHAAHDAYQQALTILDDLDHPDAGQVRAKLDSLEQPKPEPTNTAGI